MGRITLTEARAVKDAVPADGFKLLLGNVPGVTDSGNVLRDLTFKCQQCAIPGFSNEAFQAIMGGFTLNFRGRKTYPGTLAVTYLETSDYSTLRVLRQWKEIIVNHNTGASPVKTGSGGYALDAAVLEIWNQQNQLMDSIKFYGLFIQDVPDVPLDATNTSGPMLVSPTFMYDYWEGVGTGYLSSGQSGTGLTPQ